jgi:hypothetical protein
LRPSGQLTLFARVPDADVDQQREVTRAL